MTIIFLQEEVMSWLFFILSVHLQLNFVNGLKNEDKSFISFVTSVNLCHCILIVIIVCAIMIFVVFGGDGVTTVVVVITVVFFLKISLSIHNCVFLWHSVSCWPDFLKNCRVNWNESIKLTIKLFTENLKWIKLIKTNHELIFYLFINDIDFRIDINRKNYNWSIDRQTDGMLVSFILCSCSSESIVLTG